MTATPDAKSRPLYPPAGYWGRGLVVLAFVAVWMTLGWWLKLDANRYLLLGVPLTALFQLLVRQPLRGLWVRSAPVQRVDATWLLVTTALAGLPMYELFREGIQAGWVIVCWLACAILGAPAAAYCMQNINSRIGRAVGPALGAVVLFSILMALGAVSKHGIAVFSGAAGWEAIRWTLLYFPVMFFLEEVTFRGALDAYLHQPGDKRGMPSAMALAFLWGLWHLPMVSLEDGLLPTAFRLGLIHMALGVPLAISWRIGGNLLVPAAAHALLDGVRNALQFMQ